MVWADLSQAEGVVQYNYDGVVTSMMSDQQYHSITKELNARAAEINGKNKSETTTKRNSSKCRNKKNSSSKLNTNENDAEMEEEDGCSGVKKLDHNAKERIRRMKLKESYHSLRALLPDSKRSRKKWSAPAIVDRVLKYIPELEKEIEELRCNKENHVQYSQPKEKIISCTRTRAKYEIPTISLSQVNQQEAIFQVCMERDKEDDDSQFAKVLQNVEEDEGICIKNASALQISDRICHHLHIQIQTNNTASEAERQFEELRDKLISWLR